MWWGMQSIIFICEWTIEAHFGHSLKHFLDSDFVSLGYGMQQIDTTLGVWVLTVFNFLDTYQDDIVTKA